MALATTGYAEYSHLAHRELSRMRSSYGTMGRQHKRIGYDLGYTGKLNILAETIHANAVVTKKISQMAGATSVLCPKTYASSAAQRHQQLAQIRDVLKQFVREWSVEGGEERSKTFTPIMDVLTTIVPQYRDKITVLVPGSGLGRLAWEIASMGFDTTSNELSPYMNLAFRFLLSRSSTPRVHHHVVHPFGHWFSHQRSNSSLFRSVTFPDILPSLFPLSQLSHKETDFLELLPDRDGYDFIVTHYFIDTSHNIIATLQKVHSLLKYGGTWINLGPLLWMNGAQATMELSLDEVLNLSRIIGFEVQEGSRRTIPSEYTRDDTAMMRWIYEAEFWIAVKK
ncbi:N2227-like protein-domain-containing protein [Gautieria morchelliformis]|nr:N2227-like protein-domain-containing protein [Gautieria morchelliformis]